MNLRKLNATLSRAPNPIINNFYDVLINIFNFEIYLEKAFLVIILTNGISIYLQIKTLFTYKALIF